MIHLSIILLIIRLTLFLTAFHKNYDNLWRPGSNYNNFPFSIHFFCIFLLIIIIIYFIKKLKNTNNSVKNYFFIYISISYLFLSFFNRTIFKPHYTYLYLLANTKTQIIDLIPSFMADMFFEPPYTVLTILFMAIIYYLCKKYNKIEYSIPFWIIPLYFTNNIQINDIVSAALITNLFIALLGMKYSKKKSSFYYVVFQFIIDYACSLFAYKCFYTNNVYLIIATITITIFYIPSFYLIYKYYKTNNSTVISLTWIIPFTTFYFLILPIVRLPSSYNLISIIAMSKSFILFGNIPLIVIIIELITAIIKMISKKVGKVNFWIMSTLAVIFYLLDSFLFYYSHFRLNYQTILWAASMNDFISTSLKTCMNYMSLPHLMFISLFFIFTIILLKKILQQKKSKYKNCILVILLLSQVSITILQLTEPLPYILRDPFFEFLKSIPINNIFQKNLSIDEIEKGFAECSIFLKKYSEKDIISNKTKKYNIILVTLESIHWRYLNIFGPEPKTWPLMSKFKDRMEIFPLVFSCYPESTSGDFALVTSLIPFDHLYFYKNPNMIYQTTIHELIKNNYEAYMFSSGNMNDGGLSNLTKSIPFKYTFEYNSFENKDSENIWIWGYKEEYTTNKIIEFLEKRSSEKPYFLWYRTVYPHSPFTNLEPQRNIIFNEKNEYGELTLVSKYKNALIYSDRVFYDFINNVTELDKKRNQQTIIVMVGDHGEMLGEKDNNGLTSHVLYTTPQIQNVPFIMIKPENNDNGFKVNINYGSQIDVMPTILDYINLKASVSRFEQGESLYSDNLFNRSIYLASSESYALVEKGYFYEFRDKNNPYAKVTKISLDNKSYKPDFEIVFEGVNDDIKIKHDKTKKFFKLQEDFFNQLKYNFK